MQVEQASDADLQAVAEIDRLSFGETERLSRLRDSIREGECWIAREGQIVLGLATFGWFLHGHAFLRVVAVHPQHRRRGVARALIAHLEGLCPTDRLFTATSRSNAAMQQLAGSLGFALAGKIEQVEEDDTELIYVKRLAAK